MKKRVTSILLATLAVVSLVLPALAAVSDEVPEALEETPVESPEIEIESEIEIEEVKSAVLLDGEPAQTVEYEMRDGVCYVTVSSFVSLMDPEAMVEEENGVVRVNASTVTRIVTMSRSAAMDADPEEWTDAWGDPDADPEGWTDVWGDPDADPFGGEEDLPPFMDGQDPALPAESEEPVPEVPAIPEPANVETADLNLLAGLGGAYFVANGRYLYVDGGLVEVNGSVAAPVRTLARVFNLAVDYDAVAEQVLLSRQPGAAPYLTCGDWTYDGDTLYWLARIIHAESGNQPLLGKIAVGNVVMNRVNDPRFPDNIYDVLFQKNQFSPAASGSIYRDPDWESEVAAKLVLDGAQVMPDALFFNTAGMRSYASRTRDYVATIGSHAFYR